MYRFNAEDPGIDMPFSKYVWHLQSYEFLLMVTVLLEFVMKYTGMKGVVLTL